MDQKVSQHFWRISLRQFPIKLIRLWKAWVGKTRKMPQVNITQLGENERKRGLPQWDHLKELVSIILLHQLRSLRVQLGFWREQFLNCKLTYQKIYLRGKWGHNEMRHQIWWMKIQGCRVLGQWQTSKNFFLLIRERTTIIFHCNNHQDTMKGKSNIQNWKKFKVMLTTIIKVKLRSPPQNEEI
jgi:hypothetical protein